MQRPDRAAEDQNSPRHGSPRVPAPPHVTPIYLSSVYRCSGPAQAEELLSGASPGYVYQRDGHPNADELAAACAQWHGAEKAVVAASGMAAMALAILSHCKSGDHVVLSTHVYGKTRALVFQEAARLGITATLADTCDLAATAAACAPNTKLLIAETIGNPLLRVANVGALAEISQRKGAKLLIDNTFATPVVFRPLEHGADLVVESLTKMMNGHSDVLLGLLAGRSHAWDRVPGALSCWGFTAAPFDCFLALRGLATLEIRMERACGNALAAAEWLSARAEVERVDYPGLTKHADHALAVAQFGRQFGSILAVHLRGGRPAVEQFMQRARRIPFCPSLGEVSTTLSHPASTSHGALSASERAQLGISEGTLRFSIGVEPRSEVLAAIAEGFGE